TMIMMNEKQLEILNAAEKLFEEKGFDGTSVRDIAKAADVNLAMISYYFGSKEKLLDTLFEVRLYNFKINQEVIFDEKLSPFESLEKLIFAYVKTVNQNGGRRKLLSAEGGSTNRLINTNPLAKSKRYNWDSLPKLLRKGMD